MLQSGFRNIVGSCWNSTRLGICSWLISSRKTCVDHFFFCLWFSCLCFGVGCFVLLVFGLVVQAALLLRLFSIPYVNALICQFTFLQHAIERVNDLAEAKRRWKEKRRTCVGSFDFVAWLRIGAGSSLMP